MIDSAGEIVLPLKYRDVAPFSDGLAAVTINTAQPPHPCGYIDRSGKFIIEPQNEYSCPSFQEGYAVVEVYDSQIGERLKGFIDRTGKIVLGGSFAVAQPFSEGFALVNGFGDSYFIGKNGKEIRLRRNGKTNALSNKYEPTASFSEGLAMIGIETPHSHGYSRYAFVNQAGKIAFELPKGIRAEGDFQSGRALMQEGKTQKVKVEMGDCEIIEVQEEVRAYGFIDKTGKMTIQPKYNEAESFYENLAAVKIGALKPKHERDGIGSAADSVVEKNAGIWVCINPSGAVIIKKCGEPLSYEELRDKFSDRFGKGFGRGFVNNLFFCKTEIIDKEGKRQTVFGYLNKKGRYVWTQPHGKNVVPPK